MSRRVRRRSVFLSLCLFVITQPLDSREAASAGVQPSGAAVSYRLTFPEPYHRWMQVEVAFTGLPAGPLEVRMSRTSPGRYALHEFAKNVFDVQITDGADRPLSPRRPSLHEWTIDGHDGSVRVAYKVFGDRVDGTYLSIDATHAHINMPAALMWARGLADRPARIQFEPPAGARWRVATQLYPTNEPAVFIAPNLQYLMDSPTEFGMFVERSFEVRPAAGPSARFRIALHHDGMEEDADRYAADVERIVREEIEIIGELPPFETGRYTFLADYLPHAGGDGMEHRNSTVLTSSGALTNPQDRQALLGTVAHEFFHCWNVERIRPRSLEPFDFEEANVSGELWLGEGFTSYYDGLVLQRTGLATLDETLRGFADAINAVAFGPGRRLRSAVEMSRLAPFVDAAQAVDRTAWDNTFISYYTWGSAIGLGLDLTLRNRSDGRLSLDDYMRALWRAHGRPGGPVPGAVANPYALEDARGHLATVSGDRAFAGDFFARFIDGREIVDYQRLLERAGLVLRPAAAGRAWLGTPQLSYEAGGARLTGPTLVGTPIYKAGLDRDDVINSIDGERLSSAGELDSVLRRRSPGAEVTLEFTRRDGLRQRAQVRLGQDPRLEIVSVEQTGGRLTDEQRQFRQAWLATKVGAVR